MGNYVNSYMAYASGPATCRIPVVEAAQTEKKDKEPEAESVIIEDKVMVAIDPSKNCESAFDCECYPGSLREIYLSLVICKGMAFFIQA
jgi:hypothetical protein